MHTEKWAFLDQNFGKSALLSIFRHSIRILLHYQKLKPKKWKYGLIFPTYPRPFPPNIWELFENSKIVFNESVLSVRIPTAEKLLLKKLYALLGIIREPGDFVTKMKQKKKQPIRFNFSVKFCRPVLSRNQILCLHHFHLRSLYFQSLQSLPNWIQLDTS